MAVTESCPQCGLGTVVDGACTFGCPPPRSPVADPPPESSGGASAPAAPHAVDAPPIPPMALCPTCDWPVEPGAACPRCAPGGQRALRLPWGVLPLPEGARIVVGRASPDGEIARRIREAGHDNVSRRHAEFFVRAGVVHVADLNSSNGTWVAGRRIPQGEEVALGAGAVVQLGQDPALVVTVEGDAR